MFFCFFLYSILMYSRSLYSILLYSLLFIQKMGIRRVGRALRPVWTDDRILALRLSSPGSVVGELSRRVFGQEFAAEAGGHVARRDQTRCFLFEYLNVTDNRLLVILCFVASSWLKLFFFVIFGKCRD